MIRTVANSLPNYYEPFIQRKHIHNKDIETLDIAPEDFEKTKQYQASFKDGKRLVNSDLHHKRLTKAWKKGGESGYRDYLIMLNGQKFKNLSIFDKIKNALNGK